MSRRAIPSIIKGPQRISSLPRLDYQGNHGERWTGELLMAKTAYLFEYRDVEKFIRSTAIFSYLSP